MEKLLKEYFKISNLSRGERLQYLEREYLKALDKRREYRKFNRLKEATIVTHYTKHLPEDPEVYEMNKDLMISRMRIDYDANEEWIRHIMVTIQEELSYLQNEYIDNIIGGFNENVQAFILR